MNDDITIANVLGKIQRGWDELNTFLASLTDEQKTIPTDAAGWTVKDHVMHLVVWEDGIEAALNKQNRRERMGLDEHTWANADTDTVNDVIFKQHNSKSLAEVMAVRGQVHDRLVNTIKSLSDADLLLPYNHYQVTASRTDPMIERIAGNTFGHYKEHITWMRAIADQA